MRSSFTSLLGAAAIAVASIGAAHATPSFVNPYFVPQNGTGDAFGQYAFTGGADGFTSSGPAPAGYAGRGVFYDNGLTPDPNGGAGFLHTIGDAFTQTVSGFTVGHTYDISVFGNARADTGTVLMDIQANGTSLFGLGLGSTNGTLVAPINAMGTYTTAFNDFISGTFTPTSTSETIAFVLAATQSGSTDGTLLLSDAVITDVTPTGPGPIPEPMSIALLAVGLGGVAFAQRRRSNDA